MNEWQIHEYVNEAIEGICNLCCGPIKLGKQFSGEPDVIGFGTPTSDKQVSEGVYARNHEGLWHKIANTWEQYYTNKDFEYNFNLKKHV